MSKRMLIAVSLLALSILAGCIGFKPAFYECGGNNCRNELGQDAVDVVEAELIKGVAIG